MDDLADNKKYWKTIKPFFSNRCLNSDKIMLHEEDVLVSGEKALATLMNKYFVNIIADLDLKTDSETRSDTSTSLDGILERFRCYQNILEIQKAFVTPDKIPFHEVAEDKVQKEVMRLDATKATPVGDTLAGILKSTLNIHISAPVKIINLCFRNGCFLVHLVQFFKKMTT